MKLLTLFGLLLFVGAVVVSFSNGIPTFRGFSGAETSTIEEFIAAYEGYKKLTSVQDYDLISTSLNENPERKRLNASFQALLAPFTSTPDRLEMADATIEALSNLTGDLENIDSQSASVKDAIAGLKKKAAGLDAQNSKTQAVKLERLAEDKLELIGDITEHSLLILKRTELIARNIRDAGGVISDSFSETLREDVVEAEADNIKFRGLFDDFNAVNAEMRSLLAELANQGV